jgi:glycosyltransferase involved in cell wall biosynthesis
MASIVPISDVLAVTDVLILPSEHEGMPLIVSEAQIMGKAVVVTDVGNNREVSGIKQAAVWWSHNWGMWQPDEWCTPDVTGSARCCPSAPKFPGALRDRRDC